MRVTLAQIDTTVGDISGNSRLILEAIKRGGAASADLVLVPELAVSGYPPKDLLLKERFVEKCEEAVARLAGACAGGKTAVIIGSPRRTDAARGRGVANAAAFCRDGRVAAWYDKRLLPTYDVFDEDRYFDPGRAAVVVEHAGVRVGLTICEDLWNEEGLMARRLYETDVAGDLARERVGLIANISASPFVVGKPAFRRALFGKAAKRAGAALALCNLVGGNDDLVFDGHSLVIDADGVVAAEGAGFGEGFLTIDLPAGASGRAAVEVDDDDLEDVFEALVLGVRDYCGKCGFKSVLVGLSGGVDSAIVAVIAVAALGVGAVRGIGMPSRFSSKGSVDDARELAKRLGIRFDVIGIEPAHAAMLEMMREGFANIDPKTGVAEENIQARIRGNILMSLSNKSGDLLLTTGNKSELAVGYCTLYGDMAGGLAVISDVPKTMVYRLAEWVNARPVRVRAGMTTGPIPEATLTKAPSAELRPDQTDQDTLPEYELLDEVVARYVEAAESVDRIVRETGFERAMVERVCRMIDRNEYKRRQMATGLKVTGRAFGSGWRMPIAAKWE